MNTHTNTHFYAFNSILLKLLFCIILLLFNSCQKDNTQYNNVENKSKLENRIDSITQDQIVYLWYLDGQNVIAGSINPYDSTLYIATVVDSIDQNIYKVYAYSTKQGFIDFGDLNGFNHRSMIEFEERMDEARQNGEPSESQIL